MENNLENKKKFFAQYWGSPSVMSVGLKLHGVNGYTLHIMDANYTIVLKPLSLITDEDAIECNEIMRFYLKENIREKILELIEYYMNKQSNVNGSDWIKLADFLRSKCYVLPYMNLSVGMLIEYGWVTLNEINVESF